MKYLFLIIVFVVFTACVQETTQTKKQLAAQEQQKELVLKNVKQAWNFQKPIINPEIQQNIQNWKQWKQFETEIYEKPQSSLTAFKLKTKNISQRVDSIFINIPSNFDKPEVKSRFTTLQTKIKMLEIFINLDSIPLAKTQKTLQEINQEINSIHNQWNEIVIKSKIPKEMGEAEMLMLLDTVRRANPTPENLK